MSQYYADMPTDAYSTDEQQSYGWQTQPEIRTAPMLPYTPPGMPTPAEREARRERNAVTLRIAIALTMAVPLTAIAATMAGSGIGGGLLSLVAMAITWCGIALVVSLSHGKGFPRRSS